MTVVEFARNLLLHKTQIMMRRMRVVKLVTTLGHFPLFYKSGDKARLSNLSKPLSHCRLVPIVLIAEWHSRGNNRSTDKGKGPVVQTYVVVFSGLAWWVSGTADSPVNLREYSVPPPDVSHTIVEI